MDRKLAEKRRKSPLGAPRSLNSNATMEFVSAPAALPADVFALYLKIKNFRWHMSVPPRRHCDVLGVGAASTDY